METLIHPPRTMMEVFDILPEGTLAELIDNRLYMSPSPIFNHQDVLAEIAFHLRTLLSNKGIVVISPFDVKLDQTKNAVQPDIVVILKSNPNQIKEGRYSGVPDLLVEVLSPGNKEYDLIVKKELYERFGVKEYWVVDPDTKLALVFSLQENRYQKISESIAKIHSDLLQTDLSF
jgi:Uma2 family endonuclease